MKLIRHMMTWWVLFAIISMMGCVTTTMPPMPTKPTLKIERRNDGGIRLDEQNAVRLFEYIINLEAGYKK